MCKSPNRHAFLKALPKCEHHLHIEGTLTPELLFELAARNNVRLPQNDAAFASEAALLARYRRFTSLDDFLTYYYTGMSVLLKTADFEALAWSYLEKASADGVCHLEISFDPQAHISRGVDFATVLDGLTAARRRAEKELGISTELICCFLRHVSPLAAEQLFDGMIVASFKNGDISGVGLDSSEINYPPELFEAVYRSANAAGLRRTAHAGEEGPVSNIDKALNLLSVERIDHGIRLADDAVLMEGVAKQKLLLTVCPISNIRLRCATSIEALPIKTFLDAGVHFSINSDDPAYFTGSILENYCAVEESFKLSDVEWRTICENSIQGSWCTEDRKTALLDSLNAVLPRKPTLA